MRSKVPGLAESFRRVRALTARICEPLEAEDYIIQSMPDVSPPKWHLAHTTWFFEAFLLSRFKKDYEPFDSRFHYLFNSYYKSLGTHLERGNRGLLSRPGFPTIMRYRMFVDEEVRALLESGVPPEAESILTLGLHHEQQHQELLVTDIKHNLCSNPLHPALLQRGLPPLPSDPAPPARWLDFPGGLHAIGASDEGFAYDHECPRHTVFLKDFQLASRLVTNGEFVEFIQSGGYQRSELWLSAGWDTVLKEKWSAPLYWERKEGHWWLATLNGYEPVHPDEPVCHVSFFEADAYARWRGTRLPTEAEWEVAARSLPSRAIPEGNFLDSGALRPLPAPRRSPADMGLQQLFGDVWEWTSSAYLPYPGFRALPGPAGEYNGKFMSTQMVLRGGSCATPVDHIRASYRNYFPPHSRWQFMGIRLAKDLSSRSRRGAP